MISKITMFGFKSGVGYQLDRGEEKLFERYMMRAEKAAEYKKNRNSHHFDNQFQDNFDKRTFDKRI